MQLALNILGYPCYHGLSLFANLRDCDMWNEALDAKYCAKGARFSRQDWDQLLGNYSAVTDLPVVAFSEDLIEAYPEAKVILVERDIEKWYQSFDEGIIVNVWSPLLRFIAQLDSRFMGRLASTSNRWTAGWMDSHSLREMQEKARPTYRQHYALVESITASERLLRFNLADGWEPLCQFLGKPVPEVQFPRVNESAALQEKIGLIARRGATNALRSSAKFLLPVLVLGVAAWLLTLLTGEKNSG